MEGISKLLLITSTDVDVAQIEEIFSAGWEIYFAQDVHRTRTLLAEHRFQVGLMVLMPLNGDCVPRWISDVVATAPSVEWIALLPQRCLDFKPVRTLITKYCYDYHTLPVDPQRLRVTLGHAYGMAELTERSLRLLQQATVPKGRFGMVGGGPAMHALFHGIERAAEVNDPVLILGESGTGKELTAQAIHEQSPRAAGPFVVVNCAALPASLIQSELFGHEKGAFTGAHERRIGRIESASGGTLFLDEIGELPFPQQVNLLRFLQEHVIERVGGRQSIRVDARIIAATHVDLEAAIRERRFREDLYYRLNVISLRMPSLRDRGDDIEELANAFFQRFSGHAWRRVKGFSEETLGLLRAYDWPGNVRELMNRIRQAMVLGEGALISPADMGLERRSARRHLITLEEAREAAEREAVRNALRRTRNNISRAARDLGVSRVTLYRLIEKHHLAQNRT